MFKSIFSKYFAVVAAAVLTAFVALGAAQTLISSRYWISDRQDTLCRSAGTIADYTANYIAGSPDSKYVIGDSIKDSILPLFDLLVKADANPGEVLVVTTNGHVLLSTNAEVAVGQTVPESVMALIRENAADGNWFFTGTLGGLYADGQYTGVAAVVYGGDTVEYVLVSSPMDSLTAYLTTNLQVFFWSATTVLALAFAATYVLTYRLVRPLKQMAEATRRFAEGDFSYRLTVRGRDEVAQLAAALNSMAASLSSVEGTHRQFVGNVSHELKTPMTTISGFIDGILDGTIPPERRDHYLQIVSDEVKRLSRLVRSMLDLSRIDSGAMTLTRTRFDLSELCCTTLLSFEQRLEEKQITVEGLENAGRCYVLADRDLIGQVVYNLIDNATKFINEGGTLTLSLQPQGRLVSCRIRNTGPGISAEELPHIFDRFYKSDRSRGLDKSGAGLGLYIVKNIISLHGGEITVRSAEGEYCEFCFRLSAAEETSA